MQPKGLIVSHDNFAVKLVPLLNEVVEWVFAQIHLIQQSTVYGVTRDSVSFIVKILNKVMVFIFVRMFIMSLWLHMLLSYHEGSYSLIFFSARHFPLYTLRRKHCHTRNTVKYGISG